MDQGIFPTAISAIKTEFDLTDSQFGLFASSFYFGKLLGSLLFIFTIHHINRKYVLVFSLVIISLCLYVITMSKWTQLWLLCLIRVVFGLFQVYFLIYMPLWCEQFLFHGTRLAMITLIQLSVPLGVALGCLVETIIGWKPSLYIEIIANCCISFALLVGFNEKHFALNTFSAYDQKDNSVRSQMTVYSIFNTKGKSMTVKSDGDKEGNRNVLCITLKYIVNKKSLVFALMTRALLVLPLTVLQIWLNDYESYALQNSGTSVHQRLISYCIVCTISPTIGTIIGGICVNRLSSNSQGRANLIVSFFLFGIGYISSIFTVSFNSIILLTLILSIIIIFNTSIIPILTGFIIMSTPNELHSLIGSITIILSIVLGHLPGPLLYGILNEYGVELYYNPSYAMNSISYFLIAPLLMLLLSIIFKYCEKDNDTLTTGDYMQPSSIKAKRSNLFTTSIAGIYGNHLDINEENQDDDDNDAKAFAIGSRNISGEYNNHSHDSLLFRSRPDSNPLKVLSALEEDNDSSHSSADIKD